MPLTLKHHKTIKQRPANLLAGLSLFVGLTSFDMGKFSHTQCSQWHSK